MISGPQLAVGNNAGGNTLPPKTPEENSARSAPAQTSTDQVTLSEKSTGREAAAETVEAKIKETVQLTLGDLPPLKFFTEEDVAAYEENLMETFTQRGIDTSIPINLRTNGEGYVVVDGDHPDKAAIEQVFKDDKDLRNGFVQSSNYFLFKEFASLHEQWLEKIESGVTLEAAGDWLLSAAKAATAKMSGGLSFSEGHFQDPFGGGKNASAAIKAYQG